MTLRQLQAFILTCELGSFTRTGERMLITQSAVTLLIKQLERDLGVTLFDRTTRALRLTSAANEALPIARRMLRNQELLTDSLRALAIARSFCPCWARVGSPLPVAPVFWQQSRHTAGGATSDGPIS